jgi:phosphoglycolate phosphatase-like HAD superfamily hydrolase
MAAFGRKHMSKNELCMELIRPRNGSFQYAVLDFDGTLSLIREGWQQIMIPYFTDILIHTPEGRLRGPAALNALAREFIFFHTGKQTIYQCIALAEEIKKLGGTPDDPQVYKDEYHRRLLIRIDDRLKGLENGSIDPETLTVPGTYELLAMLQNHGLTLYLASGTDETYVRSEARLLKLDHYFEGHIYGAQRDYKAFSKKMVIERILRENQLSGQQLLGFGDGYVEIENVKAVGGTAVGVASDESARQGIDEWKRDRLIRAGADVIIPDYRSLDELEAYLFS